MDFGMRLDQIYNAGLGFHLQREMVGWINVEQYSRCDVPIATVSQALFLQVEILETRLEHVRRLN
ncbi:MAG: hypothetical protein CM15mP45_14530 [Deltaproteobacteria bacterium]|nr:MAG: hypothetical protein CM15mP45_14530 [Deltaproteobacteria bacterium]